MRKPSLVPYSKLDNPQSLNLYSFVQNSPVTSRDPDGHVCIFGIGNTCQDNAPLPPSTKQPFIPPAPWLRPNPVFKDVKHAGAAADRAAQQGQKKTGAEHASSVFKVSNGIYTYTDPVTQGQKGAVDPNNTTGKHDPKTTVDLKLSPIPIGTELAAEAHSHPDTNGFSGEDVQRAHDLTIKSNHHPEFEGIYVGQPDGTVIWYNDKTPAMGSYAPGDPK